MIEDSKKNKEYTSTANSLENDFEKWLQERKIIEEGLQQGWQEKSLTPARKKARISDGKSYGLELVYESAENAVQKSGNSDLERALQSLKNRMESQFYECDGDFILNIGALDTSINAKDTTIAYDEKLREKARKWVKKEKNTQDSFVRKCRDCLSNWLNYYA